jgi:hypothetical protein
VLQELGHNPYSPPDQIAVTARCRTMRVVSRKTVDIVCASKKGVSAHQIHRTLEVTYNTAWFLCHRIREAMRGGKLGPLGGTNKVVEADQTIIGGKAKRLCSRAEEIHGARHLRRRSPCQRGALAPGSTALSSA